MEKILIVDDEAFIRENLERILTEDGYRPFSTESPEDAVKQVSEEDIDLVLLDLNLGATSGLDVLQQMKEVDPGVLVIIITGYGTVESAVEAIKMGAYDYIKKPFKADAIRLIVRLALETQQLRREVRQLRRENKDPSLLDETAMVGSSQAMIAKAAKKVSTRGNSCTSVSVTNRLITSASLLSRERMSPCFRSW